MKILPKEEFEKLIYERSLEEGMSEEDAAFEAMSTGGTTTPEGEIILPEGTSTKKKLHELGHQEFGFQKIITSTEERTVGDTAYSEILAEKYAWEHMGKEITYRVGLPALTTLMYEEKLKPREAVDVVVEVLEKYMGIPVPSSGKKEFRSWAQRYKRVI